MRKEELIKAIENIKGRSAWQRGVKLYAVELLEDIEINDDNFCNSKLIEKTLLNGADSWDDFSWCGCSLIYDRDIAERLCNNTELKLTNFGEKDPNKREQWLDVQSRALFQACILIKTLAL